MKNLLSFRLKIGLLIVFIGVFIATSGIAKGKEIDRVRIENKTRALTVESIKELGISGDRSQFAVTVKNNYDNPVAAYRIRIADHLTDQNTISSVERGGFIDGWSLQPGDADIVRFWAASKGEIVLTLNVAVFENGDGDGDTEDFAKLKEIRAGIKLAYQQLVPIFRQAVNEDKFVSSVNNIQSLRNEIELLSDRNVPVTLRRGFSEAKNYIRVEIDDLKAKLNSNPTFTSKTLIVEKIEKIEKALAKL